MPDVIEMEVWGVRTWTNLEVLRGLILAASPTHPIVGHLAEIFAKIEQHDILVASASAVRRENMMVLRAYPSREHGTPATAQEHQVKLIECPYCKEVAYPGQEKKETSHKRRCAYLLAIQVMET